MRVKEATEAFNEEPQAENTMYAPTETRALSPEEAAVEALTPPASSEDQRAQVYVVENIPTGDVKERRFEGDRIVEVVNTEDTELPIAVSGDDDYSAVRANADVDYTATATTEENDVTK